VAVVSRHGEPRAHQSTQGWLGARSGDRGRLPRRQRADPGGRVGRRGDGGRVGARRQPAARLGRGSDARRDVHGGGGDRERGRRRAPGGAGGQLPRSPRGGGRDSARGQLPGGGGGGIARRGSVARPARVRTRRRRPATCRPGRRARPVDGPPRTRSCRGRWPPSPARRPAGLGQDHARAAHSRPAAGPRPHHLTTGHDGALGGRGEAAGRGPGTAGTVPGAPPQQLDGVVGGWRQHLAAPGRDQPQPWGSPVPRRAGRVRPPWCSTGCANHSRRA
jgi:hypothetical protein